jgi:hypothetical protein
MDKTYFAISDLNGANLVNKFLDYDDKTNIETKTLEDCKDILGENYKIIICGNVINSIYNFNNNNIRNLIEINDNNNIELIASDLDIHKIKLILLSKLNNDIDDKHIKKFNNGSIDITIESYNTLYEIIKKRTDKDNKESQFIETYSEIWKENLDEWPRFWLEDNQILNNSNTFNESSIFIDRFNDIFEDLPDVKNLLETIPSELFIKIDDDNIDNENDYRAFIVFIVFNNLFNPKKSCSGDSKLKGLLCNILLNKTRMCRYIKDKTENIGYFFSHGGIKKPFFENPEKLLEYHNFILSGFGLIDNEIYNKLNITHNFKELMKNPQYFANYCNNFFKYVIKTIIKKYNKYLKSGNIEKYNIVKANIFLLLALSTPIDCKKNDFIKCDNKEKLDTIYFPIIDDILETKISSDSITNTDINNTKLYQIFNNNISLITPQVLFPIENNNYG